MSSSGKSRAASSTSCRVRAFSERDRCLSAEHRPGQGEVLAEVTQRREGRVLARTDVAVVPCLEIRHDAGEHPEHVLGLEPDIHTAGLQLGCAGRDEPEHAVGDQLEARRRSDRTDVAHRTEAFQHRTRQLDVGRVASGQQRRMTGPSCWMAW